MPSETSADESPRDARRTETSRDAPAEPSPLPLCAAQSAIWATRADGGHERDGSLSMSLSVEGKLDAAVLERAVADLLDRHDALRTVFDGSGNEPAQRTLAPNDVPPAFACRYLPDAPVDCSAADGISWRTCEGGSAIPFRAHLIRASDRETLTLSTHAIVCDTASRELVCRDLAHAYNDRLTGTPPGWNPLSASYRDYVVESRRILGYRVPRDIRPSLVVARQLEFWKSYLAGVAVDERTRRHSGHTSCQTFNVQIGPHLLEAVTRFANERKLTASMLLRAALACALSSARPSTDVLVATEIDGRFNGRFADTVGRFESTLLFRYTNLRNRSTHEVIGHVRQRELPAFTRQQLPAEYVAREVLGARARECVDASLTVRRSAPVALSLGGLAATADYGHGHDRDYPIAVDLVRDAEPSSGAQCLTGTFRYRADLLEAGEARAVWEQTVRWLESAVTAPFTLPRNDSVARQMLTAVAPGDGEWRINPLLYMSRYLPAGDPLQYQLIEAWEDVLHCYPIGVGDDFFQLGGSAELARSLRTRLRTLFGDAVPDEDPHIPYTIERLAQSLVDRVPRVPAILIRSHPAVASPLFYLHGDFNGGGLYSLELSKYLTACDGVVALQSHGLSGREAPLSVAEMARDHLRTIEAAQPSGPYYIAGHCNGGVIAHEIARLLHEAGESVRFLGAIRSEYSTSDEPHEAADAEDLERMRLIRKHAAMDPVKSERALRYVHYRIALRRFRPRPYPGPMTLLWPRDEPFARRVPPTVAWSRVAGRLEFRLVRGDHLSCITWYVRDLGLELDTCIRAASEASGPAVTFRPLTGQRSPSQARELSTQKPGASS